MSATNNPESQPPQRVESQNPLPTSVGVELPPNNLSPTNQPGEVAAQPANEIQTQNPQEPTPSGSQQSKHSETSRRQGLLGWFVDTKAGRITGIATAAAGLVGAVGVGVAVGGSSSPSPRKSVAMEQSTDPSATQSPRPTEASTATQEPSSAPTPTSIPTVTKTPPSTSEIAPNPNIGGVDLVTKTGGENVIHFENDSVGVLTTTLPATADNIANAWLSQYAYLLYRGSASTGLSKGFDSNVRTVEAAMSDSPDVLSGVQSAIDYWRAHVGASDVMPIFWDSPSNPVVFSESVDSTGDTVVTFAPDSGPLYFNAYDPSAPWNDANNDKWQDPHGRDVAKATKVTNFMIVINGVNSDGLPNVTGWKLGQ